VAYRITIVGIVQGVGFRPFVFYLAKKYGVAGYVRNMGGGEVEIWAEGGDVEHFVEELLHKRPAVIELEEVKVEKVEPAGYKSFEILKSGEAQVVRSEIPPDFAICDACLEEFKGGSRRAGYYFISCSWCGPRFSVMRSLPYDRERTSWGNFDMCPLCREEYNSLAKGGLRRFYYQGISCQHCGPRFTLLDGGGRVVERDPSMAEVAKLVKEGYIVAVKSTGGFHLAALADNDDVVLKLRERKMRKRQPFAVMALEDVLPKLVHLSDEALAVLKSPQRPILLLPKREGSPVSKWVSPGLSVEGVFLPYTAYHYELLQGVGFLVMTSANRHGLPTCTTEKCVIEQKLADYILTHNLEIVHRTDDSVLRFTDGELVFIRRSRGYAPRWIRVKRRLRRDVVAFGADLATAGAVAFEDKIVPTQYIGDLDDLGAAEELERELKWFAQQYKLRDVVAICDKNPAYVSRKLCESWGDKSEALQVQHHHAHALAVAADAGIDGPFVAVAIDGVGYGDDGQAWGGEVLLVEGARFKRLYHLRYVSMPGGDVSTKWPARMAVAYLIEALGSGEGVEAALRLGLQNRLRWGVDELMAVARMVPYPLKTSSVGRFLDAVSALLGVCWERTYEGEPAIMLEDFARGGTPLPVEIEIKGREIDVVEFFANIVSLKAPPKDIALTAQLSLGKALGEAARIVAESEGVDHVVVGGGAAVNDFIIRGIATALGKRPILPKRIPPGDGGIAVGQAYFVSYVES